MLVHINRAADYISICFPKFFFSPGTSCLTIHSPFLELHLYRMQKKSVASPLSWAFSQLTNLNSDNEDSIRFYLIVLCLWIDALFAAAKSLQSCPTLCDPIDVSPLGSPVSGILQARTLEWVAISFSKEWKWKVKMKSLSRVQLLATPWTAAYQAPQSTGFSRQEYWSGVPLPSPIELLKYHSLLYIYSAYLLPKSIYVESILI